MISGVSGLGHPAVQYAKAVGMRALVGLPLGSFGLGVFDVVLTRKTVRGSIVGPRQDLTQSLACAATGHGPVNYQCERLENINQALAALQAGTVHGRIVLDLML